MDQGMKGGPEAAAARGTRFLENLAYLVPGYRGYKEKELRREEDSRLRGRVLAKISGIRGMIEDRIARLAEQTLDSAVGAFNRRLTRLETLAEAIRYAPYGFAGFFDAARVREETIERLLETDLLLFQDLDELAEMVRGAPFPPRTRPALTAFVEDLDERLDRVETRLLLRDKILGDA